MHGQTIILILVLAMVLSSFFPSIPAGAAKHASSDNFAEPVNPAGSVLDASVSNCGHAWPAGKTVTENVGGGSASIIQDNTSSLDTGSYASLFPPGTLSAISVYAGIDHPSQGDLVILLIAPDGTHAVLHNRMGGDTPYARPTYDTATHPNLASFTGMDADGKWVLLVGDYSAGRTGIFSELEIAITYSGCPPDLAPRGIASAYDAYPDLSIPDDTDSQDRSSVITVADVGTLSGITVYANITHTYRGDVKVVLTSPDGEQAVLHNRSGGDMDNVWIKTNDDENGNLASFVGSSITGDWALSVGDYSANHTGTLHEWGITVSYENLSSYGLVTGHPGYSVTVSPSLGIPDDTDSQDRSSMITVADTGTLTGIVVYVDITHTYRGDVKVVLTSPDGEQAVLHNRSGGDMDNILVKTHSGESEDLASFAGSGITGDWTLSVGDYSGGDIGTLEQWGMVLFTSEPESRA